MLSQSKRSTKSIAIRNYIIVTASYWGFTLTDGALRMLVLLHFYRLGYSPFTLAFLFLLYEAAGVVANLIGGWLAAKYGISRMLVVGLTTQIVGLLMMSAILENWSAALSVAWVVIAQGICGVAKDLTKTASKSAIKITVGEASEVLFRWVAWFTGSKNAMKGLGFFLGGLLLEIFGFRGALWIMASILAVILLAVKLSLPRLMGKTKASKNARELFAKSKGVNLLALARIFLFVADGWFEWKKNPTGEKYPIFIHADQVIFYFAGIRNGSRAAIVTIDAHPYLANIHYRQPMLLDQGEASCWLKNKQKISSSNLLGKVKSYPVSKYVNSPLNNDQRCILKTETE